MTVTGGRARPAFRLFVALAALVALLDLAHYAAGYFFLYDDYALIVEGSTHSLGDTIGRPAIGFWRPLVFLMLRGETALFGRGAPAGYLAVSLIIHLLSALLLYAIARRLKLSKEAGAAGALLFLISPWASEVLCWLSGRFDDLSTLGILGATLAALVLVEEKSAARRALAFAAGCAGTVTALFAKENGVVLPLIVVAAFLASGARGIRRRVAPAAYLASVTLITMGYLLLRQRILPHLGGAYGPAGSLFKSANLARNGVNYLLAVLTPPLGGLFARDRARLGVALVMLLAFGAAARSLRRAELRALLFSVAAFLVALAPVLWAAPVPGSSISGRFVYHPGAWASLAAGTLLAPASSIAGGTRGARARSAALVILVAAAAVSLHLQIRVWKRATVIARRGIEEFAPMLDRGLKSVYVSDLPSYFAEGPYVLKDYCFACYYGNHQVPTVSARRMILEVREGAAAFKSWSAVDPAPRDSSGTVLTLDLPVRDIPAPAVPAR